MSDTTTTITTIKAEEYACDAPTTITTVDSSPNIKAEEVVEDTDLKATSEIKHEEISDDKVEPPTVEDIANPLFGRAGSVNIKTEDSEDVQVIEAPTRNRAQSGRQRTARSCEKATVAKFAEVTKQIQTRLQKDDGVMVDCTYFAPDGSATVNEQSRDWVHLMKLRSDMPFCLIKSTIIDGGPYAQHVALIIRQEMPFQFLALPLHIRVKILNLMLKHPEPTVSVVMKGSTRVAWAPEYHGPNMLAIMRTCNHIHAEATPIVYTQAFEFPGTQVVADFLLRISSNRKHIRSLRSATYATQSARTMFHLLSEAQRLSFAHVSCSENPQDGSQEYLE
ncbi:hypothetical protein CC86DRAFT_139190 [Ophiobolus disseminans]|uniref:Uncharacterized protein n=1 Tax=Ophiobolus disseminans TaxID=1469910 RepID=A0A6A7AFI7_9PLEO|nr:hypothetical protein CC86DRAFT_139190 [Ophiobolus disseminans]